MKKEKGSIIVVILPLLTMFMLGLSTSLFSSSAIKKATDEMVQDEKEFHNSVIEKYIGNSKKGSDVKQMIDDIIEQNNQLVGKRCGFISIHVGTVTGYDDDTLEEVTYEANEYENENAYNNTKNVADATYEYTRLKQKINSAKNYKITSAEKDGTIYAVTITEKNT